VNGYLRGGFADHGLVGYASYDEADGFQPFRDQDFQASATQRERGYDVKTAGLKYAYEPSDALRFSASFQHTDASLDFAYAEDVARALNERDEDIVSMKLDWQASERLAFYVKGYYHDWDSHYTEIHNVLGPDGLPSGALDPMTDRALWRFEDRGLNLLGEYKLTDSLTALLGYDFQKYDGRDDEFLIGEQSESVNAPFAQLRLDTNMLAGASFAAGVRHNSPDDGEESTVWNVSGRVNLNQQTFVRAQVGTSFRLPSAYELYVIDPCCEQGNPNLVGEKSRNTELGVGYATGVVSAEIIGSRRTVEDLIDIDFDLPAFPDGLIVNTDGETKVVGGELVLNARLGNQVNLTFDYTYTQSEIDNDGDQIQDIPESLTKLIVEWTAPDRRFGASATLNHVGEIYDSVGGGVGRIEHGNYSVVDLSGFAFLDGARRHRVGLRVENLFDEEYATQIRRTRRDSNGSSYGAWALGTPLTGHVTYTFQF
jgi:vitamin B12 transporter